MTTAKGTASKATDILSRFDARVEAVREEIAVPGLAAAIVYDQEIIYAEGFGHADLASETPATPRTIFRVGSITKVLTATAVMQLRDRNLLRLDVPAGDYIQLPPHLDTITLRHLLTHTSGLPREAPLDYMETMQFPSIEAIIESLEAVELLADPGTQFNYSNLGYALLSGTLEHVAQQPYKQLVIDGILDPLDMHRSGYDLTAEHRSYAATGYTPGETAEPAGDLDLNIGGFASAGQLYSTAIDLSHFMSWQFRAEREVLSFQSRQEMYEPCFSSVDGRNDIALGWRCAEVDQCAIVGQRGRTFGYSADLAIIPKVKLGAVIVANAGFDPAPLRHLTRTALEALLQVFTDW